MTKIVFSSVPLYSSVFSDPDLDPEPNSPVSQPQSRSRISRSPQIPSRFLPYPPLTPFGPKYLV